MIRYHHHQSLSLLHAVDHRLIIQLLLLLISTIILDCYLTDDIYVKNEPIIHTYLEEII